MLEKDDARVLKLLTKLRINGGAGGNQTLPIWASFLLEVGLTSGSYEQGDLRTITVLALPTRLFASVLVSGGLVLARSVRSPKHHHSGRFEWLAQMQSGTEVFLDIKSRRIRGVLQGSVLMRGKQWLKVVLDSPHESAATHFIDDGDAQRISIPHPANDVANSRTASRSVIQRRVFLRELVGREALISLARESRTDVVVVGSRNKLRHESFDFRLAVSSGQNGEIIGGRLSDILRVEGILPADHPYRTRIISTVSGTRGESSSNEPFSVVFDGASPFLRWRHLWPSSQWVVVLDRTDSQCDAAASAINTLYARRGDGEPIRFPALNIPYGLEATSFTVSQR